MPKLASRYLLISLIVSLIVILAVGRASGSSDFDELIAESQSAQSGEESSERRALYECDTPVVHGPDEEQRTPLLLCQADGRHDRYFIPDYVLLANPIDESDDLTSYSLVAPGKEVTEPEVAQRIALAIVMPAEDGWSPSIDLQSEAAQEWLNDSVVIEVLGKQKNQEEG